jgi:hypothetical protein
MKIKQALTFFKEKIVDGTLQNQVFNTKKKYRILLVAGSLVILLWQGFFIANRGGISSDHVRVGATGFAHKFAHHFLYYYYYEGLFPVAHRGDSAFVAEDYSAEAAHASLTEEGESLVNEWGHWTRLGEHARILCYMPNALLRGSPEKPSMLPFNAIMFNLALQLIWFVFWRFRRPLLGLLIVVLIGSSPFLLFEVYRNENIFALIISSALILLSLHIPLFKGEFKWKHVAIPILAGAIIGTFVHMRAENLPIIASCFLIYWLNKNLRWTKAIMLSGLLLGSFTLTKNAWISHFDGKWEEAKEVVADNGGNPYIYPRNGGHVFWHPILCGFADYDTKYGFRWDDVQQFDYSIPILKEKYGIDAKYSGKWHLDDYYDADKWYYEKFDEIPEYEFIMKDKVVQTISDDPGWFATILLKRVAGLFGRTSPVQINAANIAIPIPWNGWMALPVMLLLWYCRAWFYMKLLIFTLPLAATSLIVYGGGNSTFNSIYHFFTLAVVLSWIVELVWNRYVNKKVQQSDAPSG